VWPRPAHGLLGALLLLWLGGCAAPAPAPATSTAENAAASAHRHVVVVAGDELPGSVFHARPLQARLGTALMARLDAAGHVTYDQRRLNVLWETPRRLSDQRLLDAAMHAPGQPLDALLVYSTVTQPAPGADGLGAATRVRLQARLFDVSSGRQVAVHEQVQRVTPAVDGACDGYCYMELLGDALQPLAARVGDASATSLSASASGHRLVFHGFDDGALAAFERRLLALPGTVDLMIVAADSQTTTWHYRARTSRGLLHRRLQRLLRETPAAAQLERTSNGFVLRRTAFPQRPA